MFCLSLIASFWVWYLFEKKDLNTFWEFTDLQLRQGRISCGGSEKEFLFIFFFPDCE